MSSTRQILAGIMAGLIALLIIIGGLTMALAEGATGVPLQTPTETATVPLATVPPGEPTFTASPLPEDTATPIPTPNCPVPAGWEPLTLTEGADLSLIAQERNVTLDELLAGNCMTSANFVPDSILYAPPLAFTATFTAETPTETPTATSSVPAGTVIPTTPPPPCTVFPPVGWVIYVVKAGDTLFGISQAHGISVPMLQSVNCLFTTTINPGQQLWVPFVPTQTPSSTPVTPTETLPPTTPPATPTDTPITPSPTPETPTPIPPSPTNPPPTETPSPVPPN
ncbi:MAG TPA: LysM peptidoglycan-binding domain-containing protein, partial [Anaerolineales bacterium]|nr:LysM peptidoglycan-binding domain-containing protein [Anaerolineales bacterium]